MKNNDFNRKVKLKDVLDDASPDQIESFIEKNKNSGVSDEIVENIKAKVLEKTGIENKNSESDAFKPTDKKTRKMNFNRCGALAACVLLAVAVALGVKYINFGNNPPIVSGEASDDKSAEGENSLASGEASDDKSAEVENSFVSEESTASTSTESENTSTEDSFEIKGINWANEWDDNTGRYAYYNAVVNILDNPKTVNSEPAWATVILEKLTTLGTLKRESSPDLHLSVAEIRILDFHYFGKDLKDIAEKGDIIKIIVPYIIDGEKIIMSYGNSEDLKEKTTYIFPMTEVGKKYVISFYQLGHEKTIKLIEENYPEISDVKLHLLTSYSLFDMDISNFRNMGDFNFKLAWAQMYVATYDRYMKGNVSEDSEETRFYNCFKDKVYSVFGPTPEKPKETSSE